MERIAAETLAAEALNWIASDPDLLGTFLGSTGATVDDLKARAGEAEFLASVLDFLLMDDAWIAGFCDASRHAPTKPLAARAALPGGAQTHWT